MYIDVENWEKYLISIFAEEEEYDFEETAIRYEKDIEQISDYLILGGMFETKNGIEYEFYDGIN